MSGIILSLIIGIALGLFMGVFIVIAILSVWGWAGGIDFETKGGIEHMTIRKTLE